MASEAHEREKLERLCRYITRPVVSTERLSLTAQGNIRYRLKTPYRDVTTDVLFEPIDFMARLAGPGADATHQAGALSRRLCAERPLPMV